MHPVFAAKSCDPEGAYVKKWVPELQGFPVEFVHCPWQAPPKFWVWVDAAGGGRFPNRVIGEGAMSLEKCRRDHAKNVLRVRETFRKDLVSARGNEFLWLSGAELRWRRKVAAWAAGFGLTGGGGKRGGVETIVGGKKNAAAQRNHSFRSFGTMRLTKSHFNLYY